MSYRLLRDSSWKEPPDITFLLWSDSWLNLFASLSRILDFIESLFYRLCTYSVMRAYWEVWVGTWWPEFKNWLKM